MRNKNVRKRIIILTFMMALCLPLFFASTFAKTLSDNCVALGVSCDDSNICGSPAPTFALMTDFMTEMLMAIKTVGTRDPYIGKYVSPNWFEAGYFNPPKQGLISNIKKSLNQSFTSALTITSIFTSVRNAGGLKDIADGFAILFKNKVFFRDYKRLMEIDGLINNKKYELGLGGGRMEKLNDANFQEFQNIMDKYGPGDKGLFSEFKIEQYASYRQIVLLMTKMNSSLKTFISVGRTQQFYDEFNRSSLFASSPDITLRFDTENIDFMDCAYECARGLSKCDDSMAKFTENMSKIGTQFGSGSKDARDKIVTSSKRLKTAFFGAGGDDAASEDYKARREELLKATYGLDAKKIDSGGWFGLENYRSQIVDSWGKVKAFPEKVADDFVKDNNFIGMFSGASISEAMRRQKIEDAEEELKNMPALFGKAASDKAATLMILQARKNNNHESSPLSDTLTARMSLVLDEAIDANKSAEISNNTDVGYQFYSLFARISMIVNDVIGSQNKDGTLIKNLGEACDLQCENLGGKCFY